MLLDLSELLSGNLQEKCYNASVEMDVFECQSGNYKITKASDFEIKILNTGSKKYLVQSEGQVTLDIPCGRCLKDVSTEINLTIERELDFNVDDSDDGERDETMNYIDGYHLDVDKLVYSEILINLPYRVLCKEECRGLCFVCGADLNKGECGCNREQLDPRMSVIQDIFKNFKEV